MLSELKGGENSILEWNIYRYNNIVDSAGNNGVILLALSKRAYGKGMLPFAEDIKENMMVYIAEFMGLDIPKIGL